MQVELIKQLEVHNKLGNGVLWDPRVKTLWWTDIPSNKMYSWHFEKGMELYSTPAPLCGFGLTSEPDKFICAFAKGFAYFYPQSNQVKWLCNIEEHYADTRMNCGKVDPNGRFWAGTMRCTDTGPLGALYCLDKNRVNTHIKDISVSNTLSWSPDGRAMYFSDSPSGEILQYQFEPTSGRLGQTNCLRKISEPGAPAGACVDSEGCLWIAQHGTSSVARYDPQGNQVLSLNLPCENPTDVTFGGPEMKHLFVSSANQGINRHGMKTQLANGSLLVFITPFTGTVEPLFAEP